MLPTEAESILKGVTHARNGIYRNRRVRDCPRFFVVGESTRQATQSNFLDRIRSAFAGSYSYAIV